MGDRCRDPTSKLTSLFIARQHFWQKLLFSSPRSSPFLLFFFSSSSLSDWLLMVEMTPISSV
jgi:hypothetical protein